MARHWIGRLSLTLVAFLMLGGVIAAFAADGPVATQFDSHDGGAWLVNATEGSVGHVNQSVRELTARVAVSRPPASGLTIEQARDMVVVHSEPESAVVLIDDRLARQANVTTVPNGSTIHALPGALLVVEGGAGRAFLVDRVRLSEITLLSEEEPPLVEVDGPVVGVATRTGVAYVLEPGTGRGWRLGFEGTTPTAIEIPQIDSADQDSVSVTTAGSDLVILTSDGPRLIVASSAGTEEFEVGPAWRGAILQQPLAAEDAITAVLTNGSVVRLDTADGAIAAMGSVDGADVHQPLVHQGCTWVLGASPPQLTRLCDDGRTDTLKLPPEARDLRLMLVNGYVLVNDASNGDAWYAEPEGELLRVSDWSVVLGTQQLSVNESTPDGPRSGRGGTRRGPQCCEC